MVAPVALAVARSAAMGGRAAVTGGARTAVAGARGGATGNTSVPGARPAPVRTARDQEQSARERPQQAREPNRQQQTYEEREQQRREDKAAIRIDNLVAFLMLFLAIIMDGTQFVLSFLHVIPLVGNALALVITGYIGVLASWIIFPLWFKLLHVKFLKGSQAGLKVAALGLPAIAEFVTFINALPLIIAGVSINLAICRFEDVFGDFSEIATQMAKAKSPEERAKMQLQMARAFVAGKRYRPEEQKQSPPKASNNKEKLGRAFDIENPAIYNPQAAA